MLLPKDKLTHLLDRLSQDAHVFVPREVAGVLKFGEYTPELGQARRGETSPGPFAPLRFDASNTDMPPKDLLFPQCQSMYRYGTASDGTPFISQIVESDDQVMFGVRSCDMRSIECMDDVFLSKGYTDEYYQAKRDRLLTVAIGCTEPAETCFCESMGLDPNHAPAADIQLRDAGDAYAVAAQTERGRAALDSETWRAFLENGEPAEAPAEAHCTLTLDTHDLAAHMKALEDSDELWDAMSIKCLNCGTCTYLCPTCYCFDIDQENRKDEGVRFRCWDSCMFSEYTEMAGGHNPRPTKKERVRNRFMHKLSFFEERYGKQLCVGCGRCVEKCPVALDITVLIDKVGEMSHA